MSIESRAEKVINSINSCLGADAAAYAKNKHQGGLNGRKGGRYEDFFMTWIVAETAANHVDDPDLEWPYVEGQAMAFVDDVVVRKSSGTDYYQCKNTDAISWSSGKHPIATDFEMQMAFATKLGVSNPTTKLVVPDAQLHRNLGADVPAAITKHTDVLLFPYGLGNMNRLVFEHAELRNALGKLAKVENPKLDDLVGVFGALLLSCTDCQDEYSADIILQNANKYNPAQIRMFPANVDWTKRLDPEFVSVLAKIQGLSYSVNRGFFHWAAFGMSGVFEVSCEDEDFKSFQQEVITAKPATVEELETFLP